MAEVPLKLQVILIQTGDKIWTLGKRLLSKHENRVRKKIALLGRAHTVQVFTKFLKMQRVYRFMSQPFSDFCCIVIGWKSSRSSEFQMNKSVLRLSFLTSIILDPEHEKVIESNLLLIQKLQNFHLLVHK